MKKLISAILSIFVVAVAGAQNYPVTQNLGNTPNTLVQTNSIRAGQGIILGSFTDTAAANALPYLKNYTGAAIWCTADSSIYVRQKSSTAAFWFKIGGAGGGSTGSFWNLTGNFMAAIPAGFGIGTNSTDNLPFKTDGTTRVILPSTGLARQSGGAWTTMMFDTTNKTWGYGNGYIPTLQQVLTAGSTLTTDDGVDVNDNNFEFINANEFSIVTKNDGVQLESTALGLSSSMTIENDSVTLRPNTGIANIDTLRTWSGISDTTYKKPMTWDTRNGRWEYAANWYGSGASTIPLSSITAATGTNTINNGAHRQEWQWNSLTSGAALTLSSSSVQTGSLLRLIGTQNNPGSADDSGMLYVSSVGITGPGSSTTYGIRSLVDRNGSGAFNIAGYFEAVNGTTNYAAKFTRGRVSFGTVGTESARIEINGGTSGTVAIQPAAAAGTYTLTLPTTDGASGEFLQTDGSGVLTWAAASGGSPAGNFGNLQINRNGAFATPASDSLDWESATGLTVTGGTRTTTLGVNKAAPTATYAAEIASDGTYTTNLKLSNTGTPTSFFTLNSVYGDVLSVGSLFKGSEFLISQSDGIFGISQGANQIARFTANDGMYAGRRWQTKQGADVASAAGAITLGGDGNVFEITGTSAITAINNTNWQNGATITLLFTSTASLTHGTANSGTSIGFELSGAANFNGTAGDVVVLVLGEIGGTQRWRMVSNSVN